MESYNIIAINLGSTSTKVAYYKEDVCVYADNILHGDEELSNFPTIWDQFEYRKQAILDWMNSNGIHIQDVAAVVTRGGHTEPVKGGTYRITQKMLQQSKSEEYGNHATDLGLQLADYFSRFGPKAFTVDPPVTDEFEELARYSGLPTIQRKSSFHVLNQRAVGMLYAKEIGKPYESLNLIGVHMGGGISVAVHKAGKLVDANNAIDGDGPFSTNRCCSVPVGDLVKLCFSNNYSYAEIKKMLNGNGGLVAYVGESSVKNIEKRASEGDMECKVALDAMIYQIAKEIGADATVVCGDVDAIFLTGGIAHSYYVVEEIKKRVSKIAPVVVYPGEYEMQALALNALGALRGKVEIKEL